MIIIGDDWAEGHHDIEMMSPHGEVLTRFRVTEDVDRSKPDMPRQPSQLWPSSPR